MITIKHTHADGTLVYGTSKGDGVYELIGPRTAARFRYFPSIRMLGIAQSRDQLAKRWQIDQAANALRAAGHEVTVEIDDTPRDVGDVKADRADRLDARADRLSAKAGRLSAEASARFARADQIGERFAGGQPILVGHHSERRARADHKRMDQAMRAGVAAADQADRASYAASRVGREEARRERPDVIIRRIAKNEAELRQTMHRINGTRPANDWRGAYYAPEHKPATGEWLEQCEARKTFLEHQLAADREALEAAKAAGYVQLSRETVHPGDVVRYWRSQAAEVVRVNPKTVSVRTEYSWTDKVGYEEIKSVHCPHEGTTVRITAPKPAEPEPARPVPVKAERPPECEAPLEVSASYELFATPAPIVARMIEAAEVSPGMAVLEPSAGTGAIAGPLVKLGATVDTYELNAQLSGRLKDLGVRNVYVADFPGVPQRPEYDRVLMNPPFAHLADVRHVTHALGFVKPGGKLVAIMGAGAVFRQDTPTMELRKLIADRGGDMIQLPADAFATSGTNVSTVMVVIPAAGPEPLHDCGICHAPIFEGERIEDYAGLVNHYGCVPRCGECGELTRELVSRTHARSCSLHPGNVIEPQPASLTLF